MLKFLLIILLVILIIRILNRISFSYYVDSNDRNQRESNDVNKEGSVTLEKNPKSGKMIKKEEGEYVDYEEVK